MSDKIRETYYAPAERASDNDLKRQIKLFSENNVLKMLADAVSTMLVVLNDNRQIIYANKLFLNFLNIDDSTRILGKRAGEAVSCKNSDLISGGCGTSEFCRTCGAIGAIFESQLGMQSTKECRIITMNNDALDLRVTATPYTPNGEMFTIFAVHDISHEKRRQILEKVFFHDVLNSAGGISGLSNLLNDTSNRDEIAEIAHMLKHSAENLMDEILAQQQINAAERNDYILNLSNVESLNVLATLSSSYSSHKIARNKKITTDPGAVNITFKTDVVLLRRVLGNMVKNALEASGQGDAVTLNCNTSGNDILFSVHNNEFINRDLQLQLFNRSFTTKGAGRGIGTYSMKLFGEKYLKGRIWFESTPGKGTTFFCRLPLSIAEK